MESRTRRWRLPTASPTAPLPECPGSIPQRSSQPSCLTAQRSALSFAPDRGLTTSIVGRASYTIDPLRSIAFETAVRQNGDGYYGKVEYSQARGEHWRATITAVGIGGQSDDFLGQYRRNSHVQASLRYSF